MRKKTVLTQRGASKVCVCTRSYFRTYTSNVGTVRIGRRKLDSFIRGWKKCRGRADGRHDFYIWEFLLAGPVWVVPICPDLPIHFLGPLWCQKTSRLCIWSLVINSWMRSIAWTDMNQAEWRIKRCFLSSLSHATGSTFFHYSVWIPFFSPTPTFEIIYFWLEKTHLPLLRWHAFAQLMRSESTALQNEKVCLISVTEEPGDVFISL